MWKPSKNGFLSIVDVEFTQKYQRGTLAKQPEASHFAPSPVAGQTGPKLSRELRAMGSGEQM